MENRLISFRVGKGPFCCKQIVREVLENSTVLLELNRKIEIFYRRETFPLFFHFYYWGSSSSGIYFYWFNEPEIGY